ncbi:hypothetical protein [Mycetohabitans sp. B46]
MSKLKRGSPGVRVPLTGMRLAVARGAARLRLVASGGRAASGR